MGPVRDFLDIIVLCLGWCPIMTPKSQAFHSNGVECTDVDQVDQVGAQGSLDGLVGCGRFGLVGWLVGWVALVVLVVFEAKLLLK